MKILCTYSDIEEYRPEIFNVKLADDLVNDVKAAILDKYGRKFKRIRIKVEDLYWDDDHVDFEVEVYNGEKLRLSGLFEFTQYSDYWDISDYEQHRNVTISRFVKSLAA